MYVITWKPPHGPTYYLTREGDFTVDDLRAWIVTGLKQAQRIGQRAADEFGYSVQVIDARSIGARYEEEGQRRNRAGDEAGALEAYQAAVSAYDRAGDSKAAFHAAQKVSGSAMAAQNQRAGRKKNPDKQLALWRFNRRSGYWNFQRNVTAENAHAWLDVYMKDEPTETFLLYQGKPVGGLEMINQAWNATRNKSKRQKNPVPPSRRAGQHQDTDAARDLFQRFTGHEAHKKPRIVKDDRTSFLRIGTVDGILYTTNRDQAGKATVEQYIHHFRPGSRPELLVSADGKVARTLGGRFTFTERGFVDEDADGRPVE